VGGGGDGAISTSDCTVAAVTEATETEPPNQLLLIVVAGVEEMDVEAALAAVALGMISFAPTAMLCNRRL
jgi:hypothetical protein